MRPLGSGQPVVAAISPRSGQWHSPHHLVLCGTGARAILYLSQGVVRISSLPHFPYRFSISNPRGQPFISRMSDKVSDYPEMITDIRGPRASLPTTLSLFQDTPFPLRSRNGLVVWQCQSPGMANRLSQSRGTTNSHPRTRFIRVLLAAQPCSEAQAASFGKAGLVMQCFPPSPPLWSALVGSVEGVA